VEDTVRIGDKLISRKKIEQMVDLILELRARGLSQQEVAQRLGVDRSFVSRLEGLGEVRKGRRVGLVAFPVANKEEVEEVARSEGLDFVLVMTNEERWAFVRERSGIELFDGVMDYIRRARECDVVILVGSDQRVKLMASLLDREVIPIVVGRSPLLRDVHLDCENLRNTIRAVKD